MEFYQFDLSKAFNAYVTRENAVKQKCLGVAHTHTYNCGNNCAQTISPSFANWTEEMPETSTKCNSDHNHETECQLSCECFSALETFCSFLPQNDPSTVLQSTWRTMHESGTGLLFGKRCRVKNSFWWADGMQLRITHCSHTPVMRKFPATHRNSQFKKGGAQTSQLGLEI